MSRGQHRAAGLIAGAVAGGLLLLTPATAWAGPAGAAAPGAGVSVVGTVASVRAADSSLVVTRAYRFRDSRPKTVRFTVTAGTAVVVNGSAAGLGAVRAGMPVAVTGTQTGATTVATKVVARR
ncbi:hypothetical protein Daura_17410 [Dactylosporangium aurantiacum]|uniref:DUF5666 domain-containing protein n=1 Tax=Dactylosporangium aurantiacum TaxID=35754 RepID=A0A9Q9IQ32_9ACTN|nr:hypothetical protein [Dactylosporangium aurantiacum]MDG6103287.1 hypothetical protein [Dactylosporangium aurantiacum]UWZ57787.1 hypothetical protein Daura_17410 [Dactylosporangium aurantiacum]